MLMRKTLYVALLAAAVLSLQSCDLLSLVSNQETSTADVTDTESGTTAATSPATETDTEAETLDPQLQYRSEKNSLDMEYTSKLLEINGQYDSQIIEYTSFIAETNARVSSVKIQIQTAIAPLDEEIARLENEMAQELQHVQSNSNGYGSSYIELQKESIRGKYDSLISSVRRQKISYQNECNEILDEIQEAINQAEATLADLKAQKESAAKDLDAWYEQELSILNSKYDLSS